MAIQIAERVVTSTALYDKTLGSLLGGIIGDAMGTPAPRRRR